MKRDLRQQARRGQRATLTADEYRELIQEFVDQARADMSIVERLAEEARLRFGADIDTSGETE